jgi:tetratricopeptide (TPR) repeat protein
MDVPFHPCIIADCGELAKDEDWGITTDPRDPFPMFPRDFDGPLPAPEKIRVAGEIRALGNELFKEKDFAAAAMKYSKAIRYLVEEFPSEEEAKDLAAARVPLLSNRAACSLKIMNDKGKPDYRAAIKDLKEALAISADNAKAWFRLGQAFSYSEDHDEEYNALKKAQELAPEDASVASWLKRAEVKLNNARKRQAAIFKKAFA